MGSEIDSERRNGWCILRTSGSRTLPLARSLAAAGFEVWTPVMTQKRRRARSKITVEREGPIMPTFVFARAAQLPELVALRAQPISPHPPFSIFQWVGQAPIIADRDMTELRRVEDQERERARRAALKAQRKAFPIGQRVRVVEGTFGGLTGVVERGDGKEAWVNFGGLMRVRVATWLLASDALHEVAAQTGAAA